MSQDQPVVFIVDDDISVREALRTSAVSMPEGRNVWHRAGILVVPASRRAGMPRIGCRLPGLSGLDLQRKLVAANIDFPIIFITGHGDIPMLVRAIKAGAVEFLPKPFRDQDLLDAVQAALDRNRAARRIESKRLSCATRTIRSRPARRRLWSWLCEAS